MSKHPVGFRLPNNNPMPEPIKDKYENKLVDTYEFTRLDSSHGPDFIDIVNDFLKEMGDDGWEIKTVDPSPVKGHNRIWFSRKKVNA